jgi:hypothetical protein
MAVSGSKNFAVTRAQIIEGALRKLGEYDQGVAPSGDDTAAAAFALNSMVKEWVADGADLFLRDEITLFLQPGTTNYSLGGTANATLSYVETTLSAAAASGATTISLTSTTGMTAADNIGIKLDDDSIHWTTISDVSTTTIASGLASAASSGNKVYTYTTAAGRPQKILFAYRRDVNGLDTEVTIVGENEYQRQSDKDSSGPPVELYYRQTLSSGTLFVWPTDGGATWDKLILISQFVPDDFDTASNNPGFPIEWTNALVWGLAAELGPEYGIGGRELQGLWAVSQQKLDKMLDYDVEGASVIFGLDVR